MPEMSINLYQTTQNATTQKTVIEIPAAVRTSNLMRQVLYEMFSYVQNIKRNTRKNSFRLRSGAISFETPDLQPKYRNLKITAVDLCKTAYEELRKWIYSPTQ